MQIARASRMARQMPKYSHERAMVLTTLMLDTHIAVALFEGKTAGLSAKTLRLLDQVPTTISPAVVLELEMLFEIKRIKRRADGIVGYLQNQLSVGVAQERFSDIARLATDLSFTRDPFDRLITAHAKFAKAKLVTLDQNIHQHFDLAID